MKRLGVALAAVIGAAGLWSAGWYAGKTFLVEPEADAAIEQLRAGDVFLSFDARDVGGFPFGYDVSYQGVAISDATGFWRYQTPWMRIKSGVADAGELTITSAPDSRLIVAAAALGGGADDAPAEFAITAENLTTVLSQSGAGGEAEISADQFSAVQEVAAGALSEASLSFDGLATEVESSAEFGAFEGEIKAERAALTYRISPDGVTGNRSETAFESLSIAFDFAEISNGGLAAFLAANGSAKAVIKADRYTGKGESSGGPSQPPVRAEYGGEDLEVEISIIDGRARYAAGAGPVAASVLVDAPGPFPGGKLDFDDVDLELELPLDRAAGAQPYKLKLAADGVEMDPAIWALFDAAKTLDRAPFELMVALGGEARVLTDFSGAPMGGPPIDVETLRFEDVTLGAVGVEAEATGELLIAGDAGRPDGAITLDIKGVFGLIDKLIAGGVLPSSAAGAYRALALQYARAGEGPDHLISDIVVNDGVVTVNGLVVSE